MDSEFLLMSVTLLFDQVKELVDGSWNDSLILTAFFYQGHWLALLVDLVLVSLH